VPDVLKGVKILTLEDNVKAFDKTYQGPESLYISTRITTDMFLSQKIFAEEPNLDQFLNPALIQAVAGK
jgi:hypothetical protein